MDQGAQTLDEFFVLLKTNFRTKWPSPQVVQMQNAFSFRGPLSAPLPTGALPVSLQTPVIGSRSALIMWPPNSDPRSSSVHEAWGSLGRR